MECLLEHHPIALSEKKRRPCFPYPAAITLIELLLSKAQRILVGPPDGVGLQPP